MMDPTELSNVTLVGPSRATVKESFLWTASLRLAFRGKDPDHSLVNSTHGIRLLLQTNDAERNPGEARFDFFDPRLLSIVAKPGKDSAIDLGDLGKISDVCPWVTTDSELTGTRGLVVVPQQEWPVPRKGWKPPDGTPEGSDYPKPQDTVEIRVRPLQLVEGRLRVAVSATGHAAIEPAKPTGPTAESEKSVRFPKGPLRLIFDRRDKTHVYIFSPKVSTFDELRRGPHIRMAAEHIKGFDADEPFISVELTPEGIELDAEILNPAIALGGKGEARVTVRLRVVERRSLLDSAKLEWSLELVRDSVQGDVRNALRVLQSAFSRALRTTFDLDVDTSSPVPAVRFPLVRKGDGLALPVVNDDSKMKEKIRWIMKIDPAATRCRLLGQKARGGELPTVVEVAADEVSLAAPESGDVKLYVTADRRETAGGAVQGPLTRVEWEDDAESSPKVQIYPNDETTDKKKPLHWHLDGEKLSRNLVARYTAAGVHPTGAVSTFAFQPIRNGWLQFPVPIPEENADVPRVTPRAVGFDGTLEYEFGSIDSTGTGPYTTRYAVTATDRVEVEALVRAGGVKSVSTRLRGSEGTAEGLFWIAAGSPSPDEVLPRLAGPAALVSPVLSYHRPLDPDPKRIDIELESGPVLPGSSYEFTLRANKGRADGLLWLGFDELPLGTAIAMTRTLSGSGNPLATRGLIAHSLLFGKTDLRFEYRWGDPFASVKGAEPAATPLRHEVWRKVPLVAMTLPGVELQTRPTSDGLGALHSRLRLDLPVLDELFADARVPEKNAERPTVTLEPPPVPLTSLDLDALAAAWLRAADRLELSRTQSMTAIDWREQPRGPANVKVVGLYEPAEWQTKFQLDYVADIVEQPFGRYLLADQWYRGSSALAGTSKRFRVDDDASRIQIDPDGKLEIVGFAASSVNVGTPEVPIWRDTRGASVAELPEEDLIAIGDDTKLIRRYAATVFGEKPGSWWAATLAKPIGIEGPSPAGDRMLGLWFRDLPMSELRDSSSEFLEFEGETAEWSIGPQQAAFDREKLPVSLYEWRFVNEANERGEYVVPIGPFDFRPLRMTKFALEQPHGSSRYLPKHATVIGTLYPRNESVAAEPGPFGYDDEQSQGGLVAVTLGQTPDGMSLRFAKAEWKRVEADTASGKLAFAKDSKLEFRLANSTVQLGSVLAGTTTALLSFHLDGSADDGGKPILKRARLTTILFGRSITLDGGTVRYDDPKQLVAEFSVPSPKRPQGTRLQLSRVRVRWDGSISSVELDGWLVVSVATDTKPETSDLVWWKFGDQPSNLHWLNLDLEMPASLKAGENAEEPRRLVADHQHGVLEFTLEPPAAASVSPIAGFDMPAAKVRGSLILAFGRKEKIDEDNPETLLRSVSGFGELSATAELTATADSKTERYRVHHELVAPVTPSNGVWAGRIDVDFTIVRESRIRWPLGEVSVAGGIEGLSSRCTGKALSGTIPARDSKAEATHSVELRTTKLDLPLSILTVPDHTATGFRVRLNLPWRFHAYVSHTIESGGSRKSWSTIDHLSMIDSRRLVELAWADTRKVSPAELPTQRFAFVGRYRDARTYPGDRPTSDENALKAGIFRRAFANAGFPAADLATHLAERTVDSKGRAIEKAFRADGIVITGSGPSVISTERSTTPSDRDPEGVVLSLPWIATLADKYDFGVDEEKKLDGFEQAAEEALTWDAPDMEWAAGDPIKLSYRPPAALALSSWDARVLSAELSRAIPETLEPYVVRALMPTEQLFLRRPPKSKPLAVQKRPLWLRSMLALQRAWTLKETDLNRRVTLLVPGGNADRRFARLTLNRRSEVEAAPEPIRLFAIGSSATIAKDLRGAEILGANPGNARLAALAIGVLPSVVAARVVRGGESLEWKEVPIPFSLDDPALEIPLLEPLADRAYASPALGWPTSRGTKSAATGSVGAGPDRPFQDRGDATNPVGDIRDYGSGFSGRSAISSFGARAEKSGGNGDGELRLQSAAFFAIGRKSIFQRPSDVPLICPPLRHLSPHEARAVTPTSTSIDRAFQAAGIAGGVAPIVPPFIERMTFGLRPGAMQAEFESLIFAVPPEPRDRNVSGDPDSMSFGNAEYGRPGHSGPRFVRQQRPPRGPSLPRIPVSSEHAIQASSPITTHSRRTFVALDDIHVVEGVKFPLPFRLYRGSATVLRRCTKDGTERSFRIRASEKPPTETKWNFDCISLRGGMLTLVVTSPFLQEELLAKELAELGLLRAGKDNASGVVSASINVGPLSLPFASAKWSKAGSSIEIDLSFDDHAVDPTLLEAIARADGDTTAFLFIRCAVEDHDAQAPAFGTDFKLALPVTSSGGPEPETRRTISLPLALQPVNRPTAAIKTATLIFADPSYDRELSGPGSADVQRLEDGKAWKLALDREEYGTDTPVYFAFGELGDKGWVVSRDVDVTIEFALRSTRDPNNPEIPVYLSTPLGKHEIQQGEAYGVALDRFHDDRGVRVSFEDGDQLVLRVRLDKRTWTVRARTLARPVIAPPPSVYSLVVVDDSRTRTRVALHATSPLPQHIEFPNLVEDLALGHVRRRALFEWRFAINDLEPAHATLVKVDRSGGGQFPDQRTDIWSIS